VPAVATPTDLLTEGPLRREIVEVVRPYAGDGVEPIHIGGYLDRSAVLRCGDTVLKCFLHAAEAKWQREVRAYTFLADSGLPVPRLIAAGHLSAGVPWLLTSCLPGEIEPVAAARLPEAGRVGVFAAAGALLARLHGLAVDPRLTGSAVSDAAEAYFQRLQRRLDGFGGPSDRTQRRAPALFRARSWTRSLWGVLPDRLSCTHGDFSTRNLLVQERAGGWEVSGIIDFEACEYGDNAVDFARMLVACRDWADRPFRAFLDAYAALARLPSRERILLHLGAIVLDASTWAEEKDPDYYSSLLDLVERIDGNPDALPASFPRS
jgi:aminoglycoside phosphotransferase (APT) family kinase protein